MRLLQVAKGKGAMYGESSGGWLMDGCVGPMLMGIV